MDIVFGIGIVAGLLWFVIGGVLALDDEPNPWYGGLILLLVCACGFWYFMTQFPVQVKETYETTDTLKIMNTTMKFNKPMKITITDKSYPWIVSGGSIAYKVDEEK